MMKNLILLLGSFVLLSSCIPSSSSNAPQPTSEPKAAVLSGKDIYKTYCVACHGADGKMALSGAKDLSISTLDLETRVLQITDGKGVMNAFKGILTDDEIKKVAVYIEELRK